jgi:hypothetical protein
MMFKSSDNFLVRIFPFFSSNPNIFMRSSSSIFSILASSSSEVAAESDAEEDSSGRYFLLGSFF